jgi:hypothetical protein
MKSFYTVVFRRSGRAWVALCLENGLVGQGISKKGAVARLNEATASLEEARAADLDIFSGPISIGELHEFLTLPESQPVSEVYELRAVYA